MNVFTWIKNKVYKFLKLTKENNPNNERMTFINDDEAIRIEKIRSNKVWYYGDGDELLNWYTNQQAYGWMANPIYNRNKRNFFWGLSSVESNIKRIHSGIPKAIVDTISNVVGLPTITCDADDALKAIFDENDFEFKLLQEIRPLVCVEGDGAIKINWNTNLSKEPLIEFYESENWSPIVKGGILVGMIFKSYYQDHKGRNYVLFETRSLRPEGLAIEYNLYQLAKNDELVEVPFDRVPEIAGLQDKNMLINGLHNLLALPIKYYFDSLRKERGKSLYDGKLDLFDMLDEILSQASQTNRVSTPVEYYPTDLLQRTKDGIPLLPKIYNRQFVQVDATMDGDGNVNSQIQTTQPDLNFDKYGNLMVDVLNTIYVGLVSPSTMGQNIAKNDNAEAQREKEKQTIFTRNTIIKNETNVLEKLVNMLLIVKNYLLTGEFVERDFNVSIKYDEFANPSFESELQTLGPAWTQGEISTERYVSLLWAGKLSDEEMMKEVQWLDSNRQRDDFDLNSLMQHENGLNNEVNNTDEDGVREDLLKAKAPKEPTDVIKE